LNFNNSKKAIGSLKIINQFPVVPFQGRFICPGLFLEKSYLKKEKRKKKCFALFLSSFLFPLSFSNDE